MDEKFLRRQLERNQLRLPNEIYDVTAWSMPLAFDVATLSCSEMMDFTSSRWQPRDSVVQSDLPPASVAYLMPGSDGAMGALCQLIQNGVRIHVADENFTINGREFERGTLIAKVADNPADLNLRIQEATEQSGELDVVATDTAYVDAGAHMGGPDIQWVKPPRILLVVHRPTNYSSGHTWYLFDQVLNYPTTRVTGRDFASVDLDEFNTIVLPDGRYTDQYGFTKKRAEELTAWIRRGGTLITLRGATRWAADPDIALLKNRLVKRTVPDVNQPDQAEGDQPKPEKVSPDSVPGAFLRAHVFQKHWVTFGFNPQLDVFYTGNTILSPTTETGGRSLVTFVDKEHLLSSGFCWPTSLELIADTPFVVYRAMGRGHLVAFTDDPNYRAMYPSLQRLFINAALFGAGH